MQTFPQPIVKSVAENIYKKLIINTLFTAFWIEVKCNFEQPIRILLRWKTHD
jgi:hypothetical protein